MPTPTDTGYDAEALYRTLLEQVRTGNTRSSVSTVSRMAQAWLYGPKYLVPLRLAPRPTKTPDRKATANTTVATMNRKTSCLPFSWIS